MQTYKKIAKFSHRQNKKVKAATNYHTVFYAQLELLFLKLQRCAGNRNEETSNEDTGGSRP